ncbi:phospho-N-acetylmuramoyl-pentapeptide-transferase [Thermoflavimicrobium daqui]|uniref:Phospho-N-acetylmuramoyl-pentapeptide-transferase n=1 Tax=Thermoflavimicrobium daqui TaxID=2137476 RepID=A0A364K6W9_9BACL|nr:phospho-N-acetylmuramoyl-pentapeptide-transferase [Thermoflavimicrobium daqui]RAL26059.1 phospho-N-acetylmuramoyl-pentapeptide-transferase [Thermoflavimicrobium daqui]
MDIRIVLIPLTVAFGLGVFLGPFLIPMLRRLKFGQSIRQEGPESHLQKQGTPTMGGLNILTAMVLTAVPFSSYFILNKSDSAINADLFFLIFATLGYGIIGFLDDYIKVVMKRSLGLTVTQKLFGQLFIGLVLFWVLMEVRISPEVQAITGKSFIYSIHIPGTSYVLEMNWLYLPFLLFILIGFSNGVNLTDGLDGLLGGTAAIAYGAYAIIGMVQSNYTVAIFSMAMVGALLGFLVFNAHPAKVFMGDTGSLALGGGLAALSVITKTELLLPIIGGVFVMETLSVMIQVTSFKLRGKRVFRMTPLHHHYELKGWSEWRVVLTFWGAGLILAAIGVYIEVFLK